MNPFFATEHTEDTETAVHEAKASSVSSVSSVDEKGSQRRGRWIRDFGVFSVFGGKKRVATKRVATKRAQDF